MAKVRYHYVERKKSVSGQSGTETFDLPEGGFIPEIVVRVFATPTASSNPALPIVDAITKIEIVDGAKVIKSLNGNQIKALSMYHGTKIMHMTSTDDNAVEGYEDFRLILGKNINGRNYAPDFSRFNNPQIKISWDYSQTTTRHGMSCDADTSPALKLTVLCKVVEEGGQYSHGYIKSSTIKDWTQAASTTNVVEIPRGEPLLGILIEAGYDAKDWTEDVEKIKLDFNNGAWVPLELYEEEIVKFQEMVFGEGFEVTFFKDVMSTIEVDVHMGYPTAVNITSAEYNKGATYIFESAHRGVETLYVYDSAGAIYSTYHQAQFNVKGYIPFQCYYIPMSAVLDGAADTVDTTAFHRIELELTSGSSASTSSKPEVVAEYLITS